MTGSDGSSHWLVETKRQQPALSGTRAIITVTLRPFRVTALSVLARLDAHLKLSYLRKHI